jgi:hypothetical protein
MTTSGRETAVLLQGGQNGFSSKMGFILPIPFGHVMVTGGAGMIGSKLVKRLVIITA